MKERNHFEPETPRRKLLRGLRALNGKWRTSGMFDSHEAGRNICLNGKGMTGPLGCLPRTLRTVKSYWQNFENDKDCATPECAAKPEDRIGAQGEVVGLSCLVSVFAETKEEFKRLLGTCLQTSTSRVRRWRISHEVDGSSETRRGF